MGPVKQKLELGPIETKLVKKGEEIFNTKCIACHKLDEKYVGHAQWRWDWVAAANGLGFHAPVEALRVLGTAIQKGEEARRQLAILFVKQGWKYPVELPDISTKEKAQKFVGLDMPKLKEAKQEFINTTLKQWDEEARKRQGYLFEYKIKE